MRRRYRGADSCRHVEPHGAGKQRRHHQPDEDFAISNQSRVDNTFLDGADNIATGNQCSGRFKDTGNDNCAGQRQRLGAYSRANIIRHIVGADIHCHIAADHGGDDQLDTERPADHIDRGCVEHNHHDEQQSCSDTEHLSTAKLGCILYILDIVEFHFLLLYRFKDSAVNSREILADATDRETGRGKRSLLS